MSSNELPKQEAPPSSEADHEAEWNRLTIYVPASLRMEYRLDCLKRGKTMSADIRDYIERCVTTSQSNA